MDKNKISEVFNELLEEWYWAEDIAIHDRSINMENEYEDLEKKKQEYKRRFFEALNADKS